MAHHIHALYRMRSASFLTTSLIALTLCGVSRGGQSELEMEARALAKAGRDFLGRNGKTPSAAPQAANPTAPATTAIPALEPPKAKLNLAPTSGMFKDPDSPVWITLGAGKKLEWKEVVDRLVLITNLSTLPFEPQGPLLTIDHQTFGKLIYSNEADGLVLKLVGSPSTPPNPKIPKSLRRQEP